MFELKCTKATAIESSVTYSDEQMEKILNTLEDEWNNLSDDTSFTQDEALTYERMAYEFVTEVLLELDLYDFNCRCYLVKDHWVDMDDLPYELEKDTVRILFDKFCERIEKKRLW